MSGGRRGGERRPHAPEAYAPAHAREIVACARQNASFARSFDPYTSILTSNTLRDERSAVRRPIRYHGWANPREWEEPALGPERTGVVRLAACRRFRKGDARRVRKGRRSRPPSLRGSRVRRLGCSHVVFQLQTSAGDIWSRVSSAHALQKERSGSSERGPSPERRSAGQTVGGRLGRNDRRASDLPATRG
jgi:hypothetical protein